MNQKKELYIIHGWTYSVEPWAKTIKILTEKYHFKVNMLHVPGLTDPSKKTWTIQEYTKWADSSIPTGSVALGHSNGGRILLNLSLKKPNKLAKMILLDSAGVYEVSTKRDFLRVLSKIFAPLKKIRIMRKLIHKLIGASDYDRAPENMKKTLTNMLESDKGLDFSKISTNTAILWGDEDKITPPKHAYRLHRMIQNSTLQVFQGWTHAPYISDPAGLAGAINQIFEKKDQIPNSKGNPVSSAKIK